MFNTDKKEQFCSAQCLTVGKLIIPGDKKCSRAALQWIVQVSDENIDAITFKYY